MTGAFGNYRDLMRTITLNPAMGRYLNMLNNRSQAVTGVPANENYPRELMQLFTLGTAQLNPERHADARWHGRAGPDLHAKPTSRRWRGILTGWTFGDGNPGDDSRRARGRRTTGCRWRPVARYHDVTAKMFLGRELPGRTRRRSRISIRRSTDLRARRTSRRSSAAS